MAPNKYHRLPSNERCDECSTRMWYAQDGLRYCRNGHQLEGFAPHDPGEDEFNVTGKVSKKKKEKREKVAVKLEGAAGRELYVEVLQLVLRRQVLWLIRDRGFPQELEAVVKSLWDLRLRSLPLKVVGQDQPNDVGSESDGSLMFSSQSEGETDLSESDALSTATSRSWAPRNGRRWNLPKLIDTLGLCYLGCLTMRLPVTTADFHNWAQKGDIEFLAAIRGIPQHVQDRLPAQYHRALQVRDHIKPGKLLSATQELALSFESNFQVVFPPLNYVPIFVRHLEHLTLPFELYITVQAMASILNVNYSYPTANLRRIRSMDNPETLLIALVVVSAKLLYPLDGVKRPPISYDDPRVLRINWDQWQKAIARRATNQGIERGGEYKITANDALTMDDTKIDDYMDWFEKMWVEDEDAKTVEAIREPFQKKDRSNTQRYSSEPGSNISSQADRSHLPEPDDDELMKQRYQRVNETMEVVEPASDSELVDQQNNKKRPMRDFCPVWRTKEDLPNAAIALYQQAADLAVISLGTLITAAAQVERRLEAWCQEKQKARRKERSGVDFKGKGKAIARADEQL